MSEELFFGLESEYNAFKQKKGIIEETPTEKNQKASSPSINIVAEDKTEISDQDLDILKKTRLRNPALTVYMQSDVLFYDQYYNESEEDQDELLQEVRNIRKSYKNYPKYLYALYIRDLYIESLKEKYGPEMFDRMFQAGVVTEWIPPVPLYSRHAEDYELAMLGVIDTSLLSDWDEENLQTGIENELEERGITDVSEVETDTDVCTNILVINNSDLSGRSNESVTQQTSVNVSDLENLQRIMKSWYQEESQEKEDTTTSKVFRMTEERIREDFYNRCAVNMQGILSKIDQGESLEDGSDPNEMVFDSVTNKPMTRKELESRELLRQLVDNGWSELRMMKQLGVGTSHERRLLNRKNKNKKKSRKKAESFWDDVMGTTTEPSSAVDDFDAFKSFLFSDD